MRDSDGIVHLADDEDPAGVRIGVYMPSRCGRQFIDRWTDRRLGFLYGKYAQDGIEHWSRACGIFRKVVVTCLVCIDKEGN
jgi:hypothetical protein